MIHSILTRVELLCDDMLTEEDQETLPTGAVIYEMPVRIFAPLDAGDKTISIADFMFRDERKSDAVERIKEVTGKVVAGTSDLELIFGYRLLSFSLYVLGLIAAS